VPAFLDVKDLEAGSDWEERLDAAIDDATALVLVASPDSLGSRNVRREWRRARDQGGRIVVAGFRGRRWTAELDGLEVVDFRGRFGPALRELAARLWLWGQRGSLAFSLPARDSMRGDKARTLHVRPGWTAWTWVFVSGVFWTAFFPR